MGASHQYTWQEASDPQTQPLAPPLGPRGFEQTFWGEVTLGYLNAHWSAKDLTLTRHQVRLFLICLVFFLLVF